MIVCSRILEDGLALSPLAVRSSTTGLHVPIGAKYIQLRTYAPIKKCFSVFNMIFTSFCSRDGMVLRNFESTNNVDLTTKMDFVTHNMRSTDPHSLIVRPSQIQHQLTSSTVTPLGSVV